MNLPFGQRFGGEWWSHCLAEEVDRGHDRRDGYADREAAAVAGTGRFGDRVEMLWMARRVMVLFRREGLNGGSADVASAERDASYKQR
jgi:hypothetical protein